MRGLELARAYYEAHGRPMIERDFAEAAPRIAVGLVGQGSECLGFDDAFSQDHDFGPSFCMWLTDGDYATIGEALARAYAALPGEFAGFPARQVSRGGAGRVGVFATHAFYGMFMGKHVPPQTPMQWMTVPEHLLASACNGEVFRDDLGEFTRIRKALLAGYPEDVRRKKLAARAVTMAQSGQYNFARCLRRGETVAAALALAEFVRAAISAAYLLNRRYAPFYKWMFRGMCALPLLAWLADDVRALAEGRVQDAAAQPRIERICAGVAEELRRQGLCTSQGNYLEPLGWEIQEGIADPSLKRLHILVG